MHKSKWDTRDVYQVFASVSTAHSLLMRWRLHLLYVLTLPERTTVHLSHFTSFNHVCSLGGAPKVSGDQKVIQQHGDS